MVCENPRELPGFRKKSFSLPYAGGEIWFEHLDGIYQYDTLVLEKLSGDIRLFSRPSAPSSVGFVLDETVVTPEIVAAITGALLRSSKRFLRVCFIGADRKTEKALGASLRNGGFALAFIRDFEKAKDWLVREDG